MYLLQSSHPPFDTFMALKYNPTVFYPHLTPSKHFFLESDIAVEV